MWGSRMSLRSPSAEDKTVIITGANTGIGYETALEMARRGAVVVMACRNLEKANLACERIKALTNNYKVFVEHLDLASLDNVKEFAQRINLAYSKIDILINNAGKSLVN